MTEFPNLMRRTSLAAERSTAVSYRNVLNIFCGLIKSSSLGGLVDPSTCYLKPVVIQISCVYKHVLDTKVVLITPHLSSEQKGQILIFATFTGKVNCGVSVLFCF